MTLKRVYATSFKANGMGRISKTLNHTSSIKLSNGDEYSPREGSLVTVTRAISARINQNFDGFPSNELKKAHKTFVGRPVFVNHNNQEHRRTRGMIIDSVYKEAGQDKYIELTIEVDAKNFPKLAANIASGDLDSVSMGTDVEFTKCSYCDNKAYDVDDFCDHVKYQKGQTLSKLNPKTGKQEKVLVYESCHGLNFFEISYVFDPADETAINQKVYLPKMSNLSKQALGELTSPETVDTLSSNNRCPQCADDDFDGKQCKWCEYATPPKEMQDPDTMKARVNQIVRNDPNAGKNSDPDPIENNIDIVRHNAGKEGRRMGATRLQTVLAQKRLAEAQKRLAGDVPSSNEEARNDVDWDTDVTNIDSNPVTFDDAREPDDTADVTKLEPSAGKASARKSAGFPDDNTPPAPAAGGPGASAPDAGPSSDDQSDASSSIDNLPIEWKQDESGQPYGTVEGSGLDIFVNEDMTWQVLPEGSDDPIDQGQGSSYEDCVQQAFQSAQSGGAGDPAAADPGAAPAPAGPPAVDPTKVSKMNKNADSGVPAASKDAKPDERTDVTDLPDYESVEPGTYTRSEFDNNSSEDKKKLDDRTDVENFAPGGKGFDKGYKTTSVAKVSAAKALELVEAYIEHGIIPDNRAAKFAAVGKVEATLSAERVQDRLDFVAEIEKGHERIASRPRNTVPRLASAARVPNMARAASSSTSASNDAEILFGL